MRSAMRGVECTWTLPFPAQLCEELLCSQAKRVNPDDECEDFKQEYRKCVKQEVQNRRAKNKWWDNGCILPTSVLLDTRAHGHVVFRYRVGTSMSVCTALLCGWVNLLPEVSNGFLDFPLHI